MSSYVIKRGERYYYFRRVPAEMKEYDQRKHVRVALKTSDEREARKKADIYNEFIEEYWKTLIKSGEKVDGEAAYKAAVSMAKLHGFAYKNVHDIAGGSIGELVDRVKVAAKGDEVQASAVLGTVPVPKIMLSNCTAKYWPLCIDRHLNKSEHQIRKWKNPRQKALNEFVEVIGDKPLMDLNRKDVLDFWEWLRDKLEDGHAPDTLNKKMRFVKDIVKTVSRKNEIELPVTAMFEDVKFQNTFNSRPPFEVEYVRDTLLKTATFATLNDEARFLIYVMADTGARESEIVGLEPEDIVLDAEIPYINICAKENKALKTRHSARQIPLVGSALAACKAMPGGITRYKHADSMSSLINKYLRVHKLKPTPKHTLYSLRHTFKDRLRDSEVPQEMIDNLMGHDPDRPQYGAGYTLEKKHKWLSKIAFEVQFERS